MSNAFDPTVRRFLRSPLPRRIQKEKERERKGWRETECRRDRRAQIYIYIYIYTDPREQISGRASQLGIGSGFGLTGALFVLLLLLLGPPLPAQLFGVSRVTDHARVGSSSGKLAPSVEIKGRLRFEAC